MDKIKPFSLIIALKRKKRNSKILKKAKYKLASDYGIHPTTFCKLIEQCISEGWITIENGYFHVKKFSEITRDFEEKTDLRFHFHQILGKSSTHRHKDCNVKSITDELYSKLLIDNVVVPQEYMIRLKKGLSSKNNQTVKRSMKRLQRAGIYTCADEIEGNAQHSVVSSDRHVAKKLKITRYRARKAMFVSKDIKRDVKSIFYPTKNVLFDFDMLRMHYPNSFVIPLPNYGMIKVCHGSVLSRVKNSGN